MKQFQDKVAEDKLLRKKEAAAILACSVRTIDRIASSGQLPRVKVRGGVRFWYSAVLALAMSGTV